MTRWIKNLFAPQFTKAYAEAHGSATTATTAAP